MILAVDVSYVNGKAVAAGVLFEKWESEAPTAELAVEIEDVAEYVPGQFYLRELPCIKKLIDNVAQPFECIVIDGYVTLGEAKIPGLGMHLWEALGAMVKVIGVAKSSFPGTSDNAKLYRGASKNPLYITAAGLSLDEAKQCIEKMAGKYRMPTLLKRVDQLSRRILLTDTFPGERPTEPQSSVKTGEGEN
jgi:deoxyribonuclease V